MQKAGEGEDPEEPQLKFATKGLHGGRVIGRKSNEMLRGWDTHELEGLDRNVEAFVRISALPREIVEAHDDGEHVDSGGNEPVNAALILPPVL